MTCKLFAAMAIILLTGSASFAVERCLQVNKCVNTFDAVTDTKKQVVKSFCEAQAKAPALFDVQYADNTEAQCKSDCGIKSVVWKNNLNDIKTVASKSTKKDPQILQSCIDASLKRAIGNGYLCRSEKATPVPIPIGGVNGSCISENVSKYYQQVINDGISCLNSVGGEIDAKIIVQKMNNESAFNPQLSSPAGIGVGQLVPISIRELLGKQPGEGNGSWIVEKIANADSKSCRRFKKITNADLKKTPPLPNLSKKQNLCSYLSFDGGFQRNVILSLSLYAHYRKMIANEITQKIPRFSNESIISKLTLAAYSRHGPAGVRAYLRSLPKTASLIESAIMKRFPYIEEVEEKMAELNCIRNFGSDCQSASFRNSKKWSLDELSGMKCVN